MELHIPCVNGFLAYEFAKDAFLQIADLSGGEKIEAEIRATAHRDGADGFVVTDPDLCRRLCDLIERDVEG